MSSRKRKRGTEDLPPQRAPEPSAHYEPSDAELIQKHAASSRRVEVVPGTWRRIVRGRRSKCDATPWVCPAVNKVNEVCNYINRPVRYTFFDLPRFQCGKCRKQVPVGYKFKFFLTDIEINGACPVGNIKSQGRRPYCGLYCACGGAEITSRIRSMLLGRDIREKKPIICMKTCFQKLKMKLNLDKNFDIEYTDPPEVPLNIYDYLRLLKEGVKTRDEHGICKISSWKHVLNDFKEICEELAEGNPLWACIYTGKGFENLKPNEIYVPPRAEQITDGKDDGCHAILLFGGAMTDQGVKFYRFINSHDEDFCPLTLKRKDGIKGGFGNVIADGILCDPIKFYRLEMKGTSGIAGLSETKKHGNTTCSKSQSVEGTYGSTAECGHQLNSESVLPDAMLMESPEAMEAKPTHRDKRTSCIEFRAKQPTSEAHSPVRCKLMEAREVEGHGQQSDEWTIGGASNQAHLSVLAEATEEEDLAGSKQGPGRGQPQQQASKAHGSSAKSLGQTNDTRL